MTFSLPFCGGRCSAPTNGRMDGGHFVWSSQCPNSSEVVASCCSLRLFALEIGPVCCFLPLDGSEILCPLLTIHVHICSQSAIFLAPPPTPWRQIIILNFCPFCFVPTERKNLSATSRKPGPAPKPSLILYSSKS